jgi:putative peptide zinc metalloprotease protein
MLVVGAASLVSMKSDVIQSRLPELESLLTPATVIWLSVTLALTKVLHEIGHALACRRYGGECHEMGLLLLVFTPCLYCNVSDAWMVPGKWQRAAIGVAGVVVELVLASVCTFLWWFSEPGLFNALCFNVMLVCSVSTILFNGNPLLRYDGYFVLADLIEIPNLAQQASAEIFHSLIELTLGVPAQRDEEHSPGRRLFLILYGVASAAYRVMVIVGIVWLLRRVLRPHGVEVLADVLGIVVVAGMIAAPSWRAARFIRQAFWSRQMKTRRAFASGIIGLAGLLAALFIPLPHYVPAPAVVEAENARQVYVPVGGTLVVGAETGAVVDPGARLAELKNRELEFEIVRLRGERDLQKLRLANLKNRQTHTPRAAAGIPTAEEALADLEERLARRLEDQERLTIKAPAGGTVLPVRARPRSFAAGELESWTGLPLDPKNRGTHFETGTLLCQIGDPARLEALLVLDQRDVEFVQAGQRVEVQLDQSPGRPLAGTIREVAEIDLKVTPAELLPEGPVPTRQDESGVPRPVSTVYQARVSLEGGTMPILIGQAGRARISAVPLSAARRLFRYLSHTFRFEW